MEEAQIVLDRKSFEALAADTRVKILKSLAKRRKTLSELAAELRMSVSGVKEHLETLEDAGLIEKKDDGHKWKYYELTEKGAGIIAPRHKGMRIMLLLSLSIVAFLASSFMLVAPVMNPPTAMIDTPMDGWEETGLDKTESGPMAGSYEEAYGAEMDYAIRDEFPPPMPEADARGGELAQATANGALMQAMDEPPRNSEVPLFVVVALLSLGTMLICIYELARK
ncbi:MAG: winged helix-turn-helix domain-containing protein [Candidatus Micrarchaeota archaeon]